MAKFIYSDGVLVGLQVQTAIEFLSGWQAFYRDRIHPDITVVPDGNSELTPEQAFVKPVADALELISGAVGILYDSLSADTAEGRLLDSVLSLAGTTGRRAGTKTTVTVTIAGIAGADISGQRIINDTTSFVFFVDSATFLDADGFLTTTLRAEKLGPIDIVAGDNSWSTAPLNTDITSVTADEDSQRGANPQSDVEYRKFALVVPGTKTAATEIAVNAAVSLVDGVSRWKVDNNRSPFLTVDGVPAWEVEVIVEGGEDQDIVDALYHSLPLTVRSYGDVSGTDISGKTQRFSRPVVTDCRVFIRWVNTGSQNVLDQPTRIALKAQIEQAIVDHISPVDGIGYEIDQDLVPDDLYDVVLAIIPDLAVFTLDIEASRIADPLADTPVVMANNERVRVQLDYSLVEVT